MTAFQRFAIAAAAAALGLAPGLAREAAAIEIQRVISPGGVEAWLVEERSIPIISLSFAVVGGAYADPPGKAGLSHLLSATLDEGAGDILSEEFQRRLNERAIEMSFSADRDSFQGDLDTLSEFRDEAFELFALAITEPRFDVEPVERMKRQLLASIEQDETDPEERAAKALYATMFGDDGYGRPKTGTAESMAALTPDDLRNFRRRLFTRDRLRIAVVGDIDASTLGPLLDRTFGRLAEESDLPPIPDIMPAEGPKLVTVEQDTPQTELRFGLRGLKRDDPDYIPAYVMNFVLGGGGFSSRLHQEVREKRGLSYSAFSYMFSLKGVGLIVGGAGTRSDRAAETLAVIRSEIARMAESGPSEEELAATKLYLTGAYPLRFDSNAKIANQLVGIQLEELGIDYVNRRNDLINAVTIEDVRRLARSLLDPGKLVVVAVGSKQSLEAIAGGG